VSHVSATINIDAPPERVWEVALDPKRLADWVTIHRKLHEAPQGPVAKGDEMVQTLHLRGANFKVRWKASEVDAPHRVVWNGRGPLHSQACTSYELEPDGNGGTRFLYENDFTAPGGPLGAAASRIVTGDVPQREAKASLERLKRLVESGSSR
jgi:uncharacterized protein YndB with AHSA1/START domain